MLARLSRTETETPEVEACLREEIQWWLSDACLTGDDAGMFLVGFHLPGQAVRQRPQLGEHVKVKVRARRRRDGGREVSVGLVVVECLNQGGGG